MVCTTLFSTHQEDLAGELLVDTRLHDDIAPVEVPCAAMFLPDGHGLGLS
ncbi:MAG: hypothetical protein QGH11_08520 [Pirellulaceae bacterium]|nr:hypothetical protein [Pirellulaceae bacterium]